jgi:glycosyltransferase involved in cell wall biosynthesis
MERRLPGILKDNPFLKGITRNTRWHHVVHSFESFLFKIFSVIKFAKTTQEVEIVIMGYPVISTVEWQKKKDIELSKREQHQNLFTLMSEELKPETGDHTLESIQCELTVIISIYRSGELLDLFLGNLKEQSIFEKTEVIIVLVDPKLSERELIVNFAESHPNVELEIAFSRITIYSAWNLAIKKCSTPYITNMNVDDLRSPNSLEVQLKFMESHPWVDVGYQDFYYLRDRDLDWISVANIGAISKSPPVTLTELAWFGLNPPHNAPIWKRDLHAKIGYFDENFMSAGDYEFWMRAVTNGIIFAKMHESTVGYFLNPDGLSTSANSPSAQEEQDLKNKYRTLIKLKSLTLDDIKLNQSFVNHPWDGAETLTEIVLEKLKVVG